MPVGSSARARMDDCKTVPPSITNTLIGIASMAAPLIGLAFVEIGYTPLFIASTLTSLVALLLLRYWVKEPRFAFEIGD